MGLYVPPAIGGSLVGSTPGSVIFADANNNFGQNNSNLFWDNTNSRLGISTNNPLAPIHIILPSDTTAQIIRAFSTQTNIISQWQNSAGNSMVEVDRDGTVRVLSDGTNGFILDGSRLSPARNVWNIKQGSDGTFLFDQNGQMSGRFKLGGASSSYYFDWTPDYSTSYFKVRGDKQVTTANNTVDDNSGNAGLKGKMNTYNNISTTGWGTPAIYGQGRQTAQAGAIASLASYTVGASDGSFIVSGNILITAFTAGTISMTVAYTDEGNTARTLTLNFSSVGGVLATTAGAAGAFEGVPLHIRAKASTAITVATTVSVFTGTYNCESVIAQIA